MMFEILKLTGDFNWKLKINIEILRTDKLYTYNS